MKRPAFISPAPLDKGAYATAAEFFDDRREWLEVHTIEVQQNYFDIVLKIDGTYFDRETAIEVAESFARDFRYLLDHVIPSDLRAPCPVCGRDSVLIPSLDRYMHRDGSGNQPCWLALLRGNGGDPDDAA